jgi:hypothetical protein
MCERLMATEIRTHTLGSDLSDFIAAPKLINAHDPNFVPMLDLMQRDQLDPGKNAFFKHAEGIAFTARKNGKLVGRITAQIDREHLARHKEKVGFFGFFDSVNDQEVADALIRAASEWLKARGMERIRGPLSLSINEEAGALVMGFDTPNMLLCPHHQPYIDGVLLGTGLEKVKDLYAWRWTAGTLPTRALRAREQIAEYPEVRFREVNFKREIRELIAVQDDAWRDNWGHVSMTEAEATQFAADLALLIDRRIAIVAEIDGEIAGMALAVPNLNEAIRDLDGQLVPFGWLRLVRRLFIRKPTTARLAMLGIKEKYRKQKKYGYLATAMVAEIALRGEQAGYQWGELSWTLENNGPVNALIRAAGGKHYKTYRVYEKTL